MKTVKKVKGRGGRPERVELIVNIDLVSRKCGNLKIKELKDQRALNYFQSQHRLSPLEIADYKEVFLLYDKDEDGILSFTQLCLVIRTLGIRMKGGDK